MKSWTIILLVIMLTACNTVNTNDPKVETEKPGSLGLPSKLPDLGEAPELTNDVWLNTPEPLRLANLRGQVVLLDMWTFG